MAVALIIVGLAWLFAQSVRARRLAVGVKGRGGQSRPDSRWLLAPIGLFAASLILPGGEGRSKSGDSPRFGDGFLIFWLGMFYPWWWVANPLFAVGCSLFLQGQAVVASWLGTAATALAVSVACFGFMPATAPCYLAWVMAMASLCFLSLGFAMPFGSMHASKKLVGRDGLDEPI